MHIVAENAIKTEGGMKFALRHSTTQVLNEKVLGNTFRPTRLLCLFICLFILFM